MYGDLVSNIEIEPALLAHRTRREKDKNAIMTMVLREDGRGRQTKRRRRKPVFVVDPGKRCLHYEEVPSDGKYMNLDPELLSTYPEFEVRTDFQDCYIDICTPDVLSLWSDNFDYQSLRTSFLFGVLKDYELNGKLIYTHIIHEGYTARVRSLRAYASISKDIITRRTFPFTPDTNLIRGQTYRRSKLNVHTEEGVVLARTSALKRNTLIGQGSTIGNGSIISNSVVGRGCSVGDNVTITDSFVWDNVVIADDCTVSSSVVANGATIARNCTLASTRVAHGEQISDKLPRTPLTQAALDQVDSPPSPTRSLSSHPSSRLGPSHTPSHTSLSSVSTLHSAASASPPPSRRSSMASATGIAPVHGGGGADSVASKPGGGASNLLLAEATASIADGIAQGHDPETVRLELLGQRLSDDASDTFVRDALALGLVRGIWALIEPGSTGVGGGVGGDAAAVERGDAEEGPRKAMPAKEAVARVCDAYGYLLSSMGIFDQRWREKGEQVAVVRAGQEECKGREGGDKVLLFVVERLYEGEVVQEEGILDWWDAGEDVVGGKGNGVRGLVKAYVGWMRDAESEGSSEDEDSE